MTWHPKRWSIPWLLSIPGVGLVVLGVLWLAFCWPGVRERSGEEVG